MLSLYDRVWTGDSVRNGVEQRERTSSIGPWTASIGRAALCSASWRRAAGRAVLLACCGPGAKAHGACLSNYFLPYNVTARVSSLSRVIH